MPEQNHNHYNHRNRVRGRFLSEGLDQFEDHVVLELLLYHAVVQRDTNEIAHELLKEFGGLSQVFDAPYEELCKIKGVKHTAATLIKLMPAIANRYMQDKVKDVTELESAEEVCEYVKPRFVGKTEESVHLICLDNTNHVIGENCLMEGSLEEVLIPIEKIVSVAFKFNAKNVILTHNHPFGLAQPSYNDERKTRHIQRALRELDIRLLDHVIVGKNLDTFSMMSSGFMDPCG